jgi:hypothetical protein
VPQDQVKEKGEVPDLPSRDLSFPAGSIRFAHLANRQGWKVPFSGLFLIFVPSRSFVPRRRSRNSPHDKLFADRCPSVCLWEIEFCGPWALLTVPFS